MFLIHHCHARLSPGCFKKNFLYHKPCLFLSTTRTHARTYSCIYYYYVLVREYKYIFYHRLRSIIFSFLRSRAHPLHAIHFITVAEVARPTTINVFSQ